MASNQKNAKPKYETSRLDWFFYFKRGYVSYITYIINLIEIAGILVLDFVVIFHTSPQLAALILALLATPLVYSTVKLGVWDYLHGGKRIETRLHYQNDEPWTAAMLGIYLLLTEPDQGKRLEYAEHYRSVMIRYGIMKENEG